MLQPRARGTRVELREASVPDWGVDTRTTGGLVYGHVGGVIIDDTNTPQRIAASTVALTDNATNYIERDAFGVVTANTIGWTEGSDPMAVLVTVNGIIDGYEDWRMHSPARGGPLVGTSIVFGSGATGVRITPPVVHNGTVLFLLTDDSDYADIVVKDLVLEDVGTGSGRIRTIAAGQMEVRTEDDSAFGDLRGNYLRAAEFHDNAGNRVLGDRQPAIPDVVDSIAGASVSYASADPVPKADYDALVDVVTTLIAQLDDTTSTLNDVLAMARTHGYIAP